MSGLRHISSTVAFVFAFAITPLFLQHCVMAETVLPRVFSCQDERPVEPPCHESENDAPVEVCCAGVDAAVIEEAVALHRKDLPTPAVAEVLIVATVSAFAPAAGETSSTESIPPTSSGTRLSVLLCTFIC